MSIDNARGQLAVKKLNGLGVAKEFVGKGGVVSLGGGVEKSHETAMTAFFGKGGVRSLHHTLGDIALNKGLHMGNSVAKDSVER